MLSVLLFTMNSIMPVILLILLGYLLKIYGFFTKEFLKIGNKTVFHVLLPVMLFKNIADIQDISEIRMDVVGYALVIVVILLVMGFLITFLIKDPKQKGVIHQCVFRSNFALIGVPLSELLGGSTGITMAAVLSLFTIPVYNSLAVVVLSIYKDGKSEIDVKNILKGIAKNPLIRGVLLGLAFMLIRTQGAMMGFSNPFAGVTFISTIIAYLARAATPMSLLILGGQFEFEKVVTYKMQLSIGIITRNLLSPLLGVGCAAFLTLRGVVNFGPEVFAALIALFGTPIAVASAIMAEAMDNDGQLAAQLVVWTSLVSLFSLFGIIFVVRGLGLL